MIRSIRSRAFKAVAACSLSGLTCAAGAAIVGDYTNRAVTTMYTYTEYGGGDVTFQVDTPVPGCEGGLWMSPADAGFKSNLATVLLAFASKAPVRVWAHNDQIWSGSAAATCRLYAVGAAS